MVCDGDEEDVASAWDGGWRWSRGGSGWKLTLREREVDLGADRDDEMLSARSF